MVRYFQLVALLLTLQNSNTLKILGVFHFPVRSHHILGSTLLKALADRGHDVTMLSAFPLDKPYHNYRDIELTGSMSLLEDPEYRKWFMDGKFSNFMGMMQMRQYVSRVQDFVLNHDAIKQLISSGEKYDAVIQIYFGNDAYLGLANRLEATSIIFSPIGSSEMTNLLTKNPAPFSYTPSIILAYSSRMNFWERVHNVLVSMVGQIFISVIGDQEQTHLLNKYFPNSPPLQELRENISLVLLNSHFSLEGPRAYFPNTVPIGGFHVKPPNELTSELKEYMDSAINGVILFSLGSNVRSSELSENKIQVILKTFAGLKQNVLWKWESSDNVPNIPRNVKISKWLPQRDILAHRNIKAFVTHGGLLSTTEAVYHGVPMVGIPVYGDQIANVQDAVNKGIAVEVELSTLSYEQLSWAIKEVVENPRYRNAIQSLSKIFKDHPISPMDNALYWIEYVVKHKGAHHLKSAAMELEWYQLYSLDVFGFLLGLLLFIVLTLGYLSYKIFRILSGAKRQTKLKQK